MIRRHVLLDMGSVSDGLLDFKPNILVCCWFSYSDSGLFFCKDYRQDPFLFNEQKLGKEKKQRLGS